MHALCVQRPCTHGYAAVSFQACAQRACPFPPSGRRSSSRYVRPRGHAHFVFCVVFLGWRLFCLFLWGQLIVSRGYGRFRLRGFPRLVLYSVQWNVLGASRLTMCPSSVRTSATIHPESVCGSVPVINHAVLSAERRQFFSSVGALRMRPARSIGTHCSRRTSSHTLSYFRVTRRTRLCCVKLLKILVALFRRRNTSVLC